MALKCDVATPVYEAIPTYYFNVSVEKSLPVGVSIGNNRQYIYVDNVKTPSTITEKKNLSPPSSDVFRTWVKTNLIHNEPRVILNRWIKHEFKKNKYIPTMPPALVLQLLPRNSLLTLAAQIIQAKNIQQIARILRIDKDSWQTKVFFENRFFIISNVLALALIGERYSQNGKMQNCSAELNQQDIRQLKNIFNANTFKLLLKNSLPESESTLGIIANIAAKMGTDGVELLSMWLNQINDNGHTKIEKNIHLLEQPLNDLTWVSSATCNAVMNLMQEIMKKNLLLSHWRIVCAGMRDEDFLSIIEYGKVLPFNNEQVCIDFIRHWVSLTNQNSQNEALRDPNLQKQIADFNLSLLMKLEGNAFLYAAEHLKAVPHVNLWDKVKKQLLNPNVSSSEKIALSHQFFYLSAALTEIKRDDEFNKVQKVVHQTISAVINKDEHSKAWLEDADKQIDISYWGQEEPSYLSRQMRILQRIAPDVNNIEKDWLLGFLKSLEYKKEGWQPVHLTGEIVSKDEKYVPFTVACINIAMQLGATYESVGFSYAELEPRFYGYMHKSSYQISSYESETGFLGDTDKLELTIRNDKNYIKQMNYSIADLSLPMTMIRAFSMHSNRSFFEIKINDYKYQVERVAGPWGQSCPFMDSTYHREFDFRITREDGQVLFFPGIFPHLMTHQFFEGEHAGHFGGSTNEPYRIAPQTIIEFFKLKSKERPRIEILKFS